MVVRVFVGTGGGERDESRERLDSVHVADVQIAAVGAVDLGDDDVGGERALDDALRDAFVDGSQRLAPMTPGSEEVHQDHRLGRGDALEVLGAFDERADCLRLHHILIAEIEIHLH